MDWTRVVKDSLGIAGLALYLVFGILRAVIKKPPEGGRQRWLLPSSFALGTFCLIGAFVLAFHREFRDTTLRKQSTVAPMSPSIQPSIQIGQIDQKVKNGAAVAGVQGQLTVNAQTRSRDSKTGKKDPKPK